MLSAVRIVACDALWALQRWRKARAAQQGRIPRARLLGRLRRRQQAPWLQTGQVGRKPQPQVPNPPQIGRRAQAVVPAGGPPTPKPHIGRRIRPVGEWPSPPPPLTDNTRFVKPSEGFSINELAGRVLYDHLDLDRIDPAFRAEVEEALMQMIADYRCQCRSCEAADAMLADGEFKRMCIRACHRLQNQETHVSRGK